MSQHPQATDRTGPAPVTLAQLRRARSEGRPITMLTAYDASFARVLDQAGIDCILVGDSLGNVVQGRDSTLPVTVADMAYHVACVRRGVSRALVIADLPFLSYTDVPQAVASTRTLMQAGAAMIKLEGGQAVLDVVAQLSAHGVPVCGHLGLTPQSVHQLSGYRVQGRAPEQRRQLLDEARALAEAGIAMLVLECVPAGLAAEITRSVDVPVIGIGAGAAVNGQVLVLHDLLGLGSGRRPRFVRDFLAGRDSIEAAVTAYIHAVRERSFPAAEESYPDD
ncbi:MAG: 3-methyl-2-oxobutanoate hydroxymethyltransferase [Wenzhouxiangellaceae bacterium]|nr:3-methyl-2-oxobutanoate hydroxymethyltransferase [Wenzhouxiangellaceae bacterium]